MVDKKIRTDVSIFSGSKVAIVTSERLIPRRKKNKKSLAMFPPKKNPIPNQDIIRLHTKKDQSLPPQLAKFCPGYK